MACWISHRCGAAYGRRRGAAMVETAVILPVLAVMTFGLLEYGWAFVQLSRIDSAASHGARVGITPDATTAQVRQAVTPLMQQAGLTTDEYSLSISALDVEATQPVTVRLTVPYERITATGLTVLPTPERIVGEATMPKADG